MGYGLQQFCFGQTHHLWTMDSGRRALGVHSICNCTKFLVVEVCQILHSLISFNLDRSFLGWDIPQPHTRRKQQIQWCFKSGNKALKSISTGSIAWVGWEVNNVRDLWPLVVCILPTTKTLTGCDHGCHCRMVGEQTPYTFTGRTPDQKNPQLTRQPHDSGHLNCLRVLNHNTQLLSLLRRGGGRNRLSHFHHGSKCIQSHHRRIATGSDKPFQFGRSTIHLLQCKGEQRDNSDGKKVFTTKRVRSYSMYTYYYARSSKRCYGVLNILSYWDTVLVYDDVAFYTDADVCFTPYLRMLNSDTYNLYLLCFSSLLVVM